MVAPTRTPEARGAKCDLCKRILTTATWLDQTKLAKEVQEAKTVLNLINQHNKIECPCIPKNIENLLVGSTHFEIHRLIAKELDLHVHKRQSECHLQAQQRSQVTPKNKRQVINDCYDSERASRFKIYQDYCEQKHLEQSKEQLEHLMSAINYWQTAMEDPTNPFNSKLAHRLGLTHHIIYACYLFKYYKLLDYQLVAANLLLNVFRSIEGVTANAILHAHFLLIKSLIDCDQLQQARRYLKQASRLDNYSDKTLYESILLQCVACELNFVEGRDCKREIAYNLLEELAELAKIRSGDKLQHYYARTLAMVTLIRYINHYPSRSEQCHEFFHTYRYVCAIIRRCYESSFELVLAGMDSSNKRSSRSPDSKQTQILDHSWIRYAVCDFAFSTFEHLAKFYMQAGIPEYLDLLFNGLELISFRNGGLYWQSKIISLGVRLDLLCDKYADAEEKLNVLTRLAGYSNDPHLMNVLRLGSEVSFLTFMNQQGSVISNDVVDEVLGRIRACKKTLNGKLLEIGLFDAKLGANVKLAVSSGNESNEIALGGYLGEMTLSVLKIGVVSSQRHGSEEAIRHGMKLIIKLRDYLSSCGFTPLAYFDQQDILEMLLQLSEVDKSEQILLNAVRASHIFLEVDDKVTELHQQLSDLTLSSEVEKPITKKGARRRTTRHATNGKLSSLSRVSKRKGTYDVAKITETTDLIDKPSARSFTVSEALAEIESLTKEEIVTTYLRNSEPSPDYHLYRSAHELMLSFRLLDEHHDPDVMLYHFSESITSNTMRYRWMMMEEQQLSPFDQSQCEGGDKTEASSSMRQLGFCNNLVNQENVVKAMTRSIPDSFRLVQFRHVLERQTELEHLLGVSFNSANEPIFVHASRALVSDDLFDNAKHADKSELTFPNRFAQMIDESKRSLLSNNSKTRSEMRQKIETNFGIALHDIENEWLGPLRFIMCGDICDSKYAEFAVGLMNDLLKTTMRHYSCQSETALRLTLENAPLLSREEFCKVLASLFNCQTDAKEPRECFEKWQKSLEAFMKRHKLNATKATMLRGLDRAQVGLILDKNLQSIPLESLPIVRITNQGVFRVPSLRLFSIISARRCSPIKIEPHSVAYMLDPANNLARTRERFDQKLRAQTRWTGTIGRPPNSVELEKWLAERQLYLFIGHGAGTVYYNKLCKGRGLSHMSQVTSASIVMGCSSGRMLAEGPRLEPFGISWVFIFRGSPCYLGLLWDVTDNDIDKYFDTLLNQWMSSIGWSTPAMVGGNPATSSSSCGLALTNASVHARHSCQLKLLVGSAPVVYGLPIWVQKLTIDPNGFGH